VTSPPRIVLVGLPGAGKSTVGPLVADALGWAFVDLDREIERVTGRSIPEVFAQAGEAGFRHLEREATTRLAGVGPLVLAPGGGWLETAGNLEALGTSVTTILLAVSPAVAARRLGAGGGGRPLLAGGEPTVRLQEILARREPLYVQANHTVSTDSLSPSEVASIIVALASREAGG